MRLLIIVLVIAAGWYLWPRPSTAPITTDTIPTRGLERHPGSVRNPVDPHPCAGKQRCLIAYVAPWCPSCKASLPLINRMNREFRELPEVGMAVVMGPIGGSWDKHEAMARRVRGPLFMDARNTFWRERRGPARGVPAWIVFDGSGDAIDALSGGYRADGDRYVDAVVSRVGLEDYVEP